MADRSPSLHGATWADFDAAYKEACESSKPEDWMQAALVAQQLRYAGSEIPRIPNVDHLTVHELQSLQGRVNLLLQHKVCGSPTGGVTIVNGIPTNEDPPSLR